MVMSMVICFLHWIVNEKRESKNKRNSKLPFTSVAQSCPTICNPVDCSTPGFPVHYQLLELAQIGVYWVSDAIQPSHPLLSPSPPAFSLSQHQGLYHWVSSLHQVAKDLAHTSQLFWGLNEILCMKFLAQFWKWKWSRSVVSNP